MLSARWWTLVVWALAAAGALFWGLKLFVKAPRAPQHTQMADAGGLARGDLTRLLGADAPLAAQAAAAEPAADARFQLVGVVSPRSPQARREGLALIAVDGKPPRAYRVGATIDGQNILQSVHARGVTLGPRDGAALIALNLAPPAPPATGVPPPAVSTVPGSGLPGGVMPGTAMPGFPNARLPQPGVPTQRQTPPMPSPAFPSRMPGQPGTAQADQPPPPGVMPTQPIDAAQQR